jgi:KDO2-lipid IV(A) lauroyltransferase
MTAPAPARLAMRFDCAFIPVQVERVEGARFRLTYHPPLRLQRGGDVQADALALTTEANACLENWIRQRPAQWLWVHQRWPD